MTTTELRELLAKASAAEAALAAAGWCDLECREDPDHDALHGAVRAANEACTAAAVAAFPSLLSAAERVAGLEEENGRLRAVMEATAVRLDARWQDSRHNIDDDARVLRDALLGSGK